MKLWGIFRFELAYQARRPWFWLAAAALFAVAFVMTRDGTLAEALLDEFYLNSPFAIAKTTVVGGLVWLLVAPTVAGGAAARDVETRMHPLVYTLPVGRAEYLGGRFLAAFALNALVLLVVQAGIVASVYLPGVDPALVGPFRPAGHLTAYAFIALPNAFAATAIQFALAARSGRPMAGYLGSLLIFFASYFLSALAMGTGHPDLGRMLDGIGVTTILSDLSALWSPTEKSTRLLALRGMLLGNRAAWAGTGLAVLALTYLRFRFAHRVEGGWWARRARRRAQRAAASPGGGAVARAPVSVPRAPRTFGFGIQVRQTLAIARESFRASAKSWAGLAMLGVIPLLTIPVVLDQMEAGGVPLVPSTMQVLQELTSPLDAGLSRWVIVPLLLVFFAGELVWRERDARLGDIIDAMPGSAWAPFLGKFLGLGLLLALFMALLMASGVAAQAASGAQDFEIGLYLKVLFGLQLPEYLLFALLALVVHVAVNQKYLGHVAAILAYVLIALAPVFGVEHHLLVYGTGPAWSYTEMRGFGASLAPWIWFKLYWAAWALLLALLARLLWVRGREGGAAARLASASRRLAGPTAWAAAAALGLVASLGGWIFYNTNVLNDYLTASDVKDRGAEYERRYGRYAASPQPALAGARLRVEIYPGRREADVRGSYRLVNHGTVAIDSVHVATVPGVETDAVAFDRPASLRVADEARGHRIYALARPLAPGDSLRLDFRVRMKPRGFREDGADLSVAANGTSFTAAALLPAIGYQTGRELTSASDRRKYGLAPRRPIPSLYDARARAGRAPGISLDAVVGTDPDQVGVAPGALRGTWTERGRRYFHYATDTPTGGEWSFLSARYAVREARWNGVAVRIFHDPRHTRNLDRMVRSILASLDYYSREFGPYRHDYLTVAEAPGEGTGLHAEPGMLTYSEGVSLWNPGRFDLPYAVVAHEMAHQWTVPYAFVEGAPVLSEGVAWYYAMRLVEHARGADQLGLLLGFMREPYPYPRIRRGEPLLRGLDPYLAYRKGPFALYALSEYAGVARVNGALRRLVETHRSDGAPLATTLDLYRELQAATPDSLRYLLHDLFEVNTDWTLETKRAVAERADGGGWRVTLQVRARKLVVDSAGGETTVPMQDWVEVGVYGAAEAAPLYLGRHRLRSGEQTVTVTVRGTPARAGVDPRRLLMEANADDNVVGVDTAAAEGARPSPGGRRGA